MIAIILPLLILSCILQAVFYYYFYCTKTRQQQTWLYFTWHGVHLVCSIILFLIAWQDGYLVFNFAPSFGVVFSVDKLSSFFLILLFCVVLAARLGHAFRSPLLNSMITSFVGVVISSDLVPILLWSVCAFWAWCLYMRSFSAKDFYRTVPIVIFLVAFATLFIVIAFMEHSNIATIAFNSVQNSFAEVVALVSFACAVFSIIFFACIVYGATHITQSVLEKSPDALLAAWLLICLNLYIFVRLFITMFAVELALVQMLVAAGLAVIFLSCVWRLAGLPFVNILLIAYGFILFAIVSSFSIASLAGTLTLLAQMSLYIFVALVLYAQDKKGRCLPVYLYIVVVVMLVLAPPFPGSWVLLVSLKSFAQASLPLLALLVCVFALFGHVAYQLLITKNRRENLVACKAIVNVGVALSLVFSLLANLWLGGISTKISTSVAEKKAYMDALQTRSTTLGVDK